MSVPSTRQDRSVVLVDLGNRLTRISSEFLSAVEDETRSSAFNAAIALAQRVLLEQIRDDITLSPDHYRQQ